MFPDNCASPVYSLNSAIASRAASWDYVDPKLPSSR
jgi:hypothetical protein